MKKAIIEEANEYAMHYGQDFVHSLLHRDASFQEHYEQLAFDRSFFEGILYTNNDILSVFTEKRLDILKEGLSEEEIQTLVEEEETKFLEELTREFKQHFGDFYIEEINLMLADCEEEIRWAKDDFRYHENREYVHDKEFLGEVSEDERTESMQEATEKRAVWEEKKQRLEKVKREIEGLKTTVN